MRTLFPIVVVVVLFALALSAALARSGEAAQGTTRVEVTATVADSSFGNAGFSRYLQIWNHARSSRPIGNAYLNCVGLMLGGVDECRLTIHMPLGKITAYGVVHSLREMFLVITGGSRFYKTAHGGSVHIFEDPFEDNLVLNFRLE